MGRSDNFECIEHDGIVQKSDYNSVTVIIQASSACSGCQAEGSCNLIGAEQKSVVVTGEYDLSPGDQVKVIMEKSAGYTAVMLGYVIPLILVILTLVILGSLKVSELEAGIGSLSVLIPYYLIMWLFKNRIGNKFTFSIKV